MKKGVSGHTLVIVIGLIVTMIGLILLWLFLSHTMEEGEGFAREVKEWIKDLIPGWLSVFI